MLYFRVWKTIVISFEYVSYTLFGFEDALQIFYKKDYLLFAKLRTKEN